MALTSDEVLKQSESAFRQWEAKWKENSKINGKKYRIDKDRLQDISYMGTGRHALCVAFAPSFEYNIDLIKKYQDNVDILCVDKCFGFLVKNGIKPKYVILADAGISYEDWCKDYIDETEDVTLLSNITANPEWAENWKGRTIFYVNKDNIKSEEIFKVTSGIDGKPGTGCIEEIPAGSNVGNSVVILAAQVCNYEYIYLVGYDYSWAPEDKYYAFMDHLNKRYWMKHLSIVDFNGNYCYSSQNLLFSSRWLTDYCTNILVPNNCKAFNCSEKGILEMPRMKLETALKLAKARALTLEEKNIINNGKLKTLIINNQDKLGAKKLQESLATLNVDHVIIKYLRQEDLEFLRSA